MNEQGLVIRTALSIEPFLFDPRFACNNQKLSVTGKHQNGVLK